MPTLQDDEPEVAVEAASPSNAFTAPLMESCVSVASGVLPRVVNTRAGSALNAVSEAALTSGAVRQSNAL